jgi:shikimate dehydrogenase
LLSSAAVRLGVVGWPVAHTRSPAIQNAALQAAGLVGWRYQKLPVAPELLAQTLRALPQAGFRGVNVTIPHKQAVLELATDTSASVSAIGAANTLLFGARGEIRAENTDAPALIEALPFPATGRTAQVLGAGGSARAVVWALLDAGAAEVRVWNRTAQRARLLCAEIGGTPVTRVTPADLLVHCTSTGLDASGGFFKQLPLSADALAGYECVVDLVYSEPPTELTRAARTRRLAVVDGLELLIAQGALSFELFTGHPARVHAMRAALGA